MTIISDGSKHACQGHIHHDTECPYCIQRDGQINLGKALTAMNGQQFSDHILVSNGSPSLGCVTVGTSITFDFPQRLNKEINKKLLLLE